VLLTPQGVGLPVSVQVVIASRVNFELTLSSISSGTHATMREVASPSLDITLVVRDVKLTYPIKR
jgi:hypothetical protein